MGIEVQEKLSNFFQRTHGHVIKGFYCFWMPLEVKFSVNIKYDPLQVKVQMTSLGLFPIISRIKCG